jgi:acetyl-CoA C-acetyltransferase
MALTVARAAALATQAQAKILGYAAFSREPEWFTLAPIGAIQRLLDKLKLKAGDVDLYEVNEASSVVPMAVMKDLGIPHEKMNVNDGAVTLGHPIGASGARVLVTLLEAMKQRKARPGIASLCIGGAKRTVQRPGRLDRPGGHYPRVGPHRAGYGYSGAARPLAARR